MERLPLALNSMNLVWSSLALQWCEAPGPALAEIARVLVAWNGSEVIHSDELVIL